MRTRSGESSAKNSGRQAEAMAQRREYPFRAGAVEPDWTPQPSRRPSRSMPQLGERYTPRRLAQFLLENATDAADYAAARREVRKLGLDPDSIPHEPPTRV